MAADDSVPGSNESVAEAESAALGDWGQSLGEGFTLQDKQGILVPLGYAQFVPGQAATLPKLVSPGRRMLRHWVCTRKFTTVPPIRCWAA